MENVYLERLMPRVITKLLYHSWFWTSMTSMTFQTSRTFQAQKLVQDVPNSKTRPGRPQLKNSSGVVILSNKSDKQDRRPNRSSSYRSRRPPQAAMGTPVARHFSHEAPACLSRITKDAPLGFTRVTVLHARKPKWSYGTPQKEGHWPTSGAV